MSESEFMHKVREAAEHADADSYSDEVNEALRDEKIKRKVSGMNKLTDPVSISYSANQRGEVSCEARLISCKSGETLVELKGLDVCSADVLIAASAAGLHLKDYRLEDPIVRGKSLYAVEVQRTQRIFVYSQPRGRRSGSAEEWI